MEAGLCRGHLLAAKRAKTAATRITAWTPARHRWLNHVRTGLVTCYFCGVTDLSTMTQGDLLYIGEAPGGRIESRWLSQPEVRPLWRPSQHSIRWWRVAKLTSEGRRVLAEWDREHPCATT